MTEDHQRLKSEDDSYRKRTQLQRQRYASVVSYKNVSSIKCH
jgi:hypothetical protein